MSLPSAPVKVCPTCRQRFVSDAASAPHAPFCSERCRLVDLSRWLNEGYSVPVETDRPLRDLPPGALPGEEG